MATKIILFGVTGDLSRRKLLPALEAIMQSNQVEAFEVIGITRRPVGLQDLGVSGRLAEKMYIHTMDVAHKDDYDTLWASLGATAKDHILVYLSVPPLAVGPIVEFLGRSGFAWPNVKLLLEKPFGVDLESAKEVIDHIATHFHESQVYRIDHYLAKEMAQNIVAFRSQNALLSAIWHTDVIERVEIIASETIGIEGRAQFYEQTGALRDVLQGHLMQLLALVTMDIPPELRWEELPAWRLAALKNMQVADPTRSLRAQYDTYQQEVDNLGSLVETFVDITLTTHDPRWKGVDFRLTTGKSLAQKTTEIRVYLRLSVGGQGNRIIFHIQPNEGVEIDLLVKKPGYDRTYSRQELQFSYQPATVLPDAYEQVLVDAIRSQRTLFTSSEEIIESWRILQPLLDAWAMDQQPLHTYPAGSTMQSIQSTHS